MKDGFTNDAYFIGKVPYGISLVQRSSMVVTRVTVGVSFRSSPARNKRIFAAYCWWLETVVNLRVCACLRLSVSVCVCFRLIHMSSAFPVVVISMFRGPSTGTMKDRQKAFTPFNEETQPEIFHTLCALANGCFVFCCVRFFLFWRGRCCGRRVSISFWR